MQPEAIDRINQLARKSREEGLTEAEKEEQARLRRQYIDDVKRNLRARLDSLRAPDEDGGGPGLP